MNMGNVLLYNIHITVYNVQYIVYKTISCRVSLPVC